MPDPTAPDPHPAGHEVEIDLAAFLPEGTTFAAPDPGDAVDVGAEAHDDDDEAGGPTLAEPGDAVAAPEAPPGPEARPAPVDLGALTQIEADLAAVDAALVAIDRGDLDGSALLVELLAPPA